MFMSLVKCPYSGSCKSSFTMLNLNSFVEGPTRLNIVRGEWKRYHYRMIGCNVKGKHTLNARLFNYCTFSRVSQGLIL